MTIVGGFLVLVMIVGFVMSNLASGDIDDYFLLSTSGIPPESFTDLYLPVCHVDGRLSLPLLRRALDQIEKLADLRSLPVLRTEAALLQEGLPPNQIRAEDGALTTQARDVLAASVLELLLQPQT